MILRVWLVADDKTAVQSEDAESIGYIIPTPVVDHFIQDYERNGRYTAFPNLGVEWQKLESPHLRKALGMKVSTFVWSGHAWCCLDRESKIPALWEEDLLYLMGATPSALWGRVIG